MSFWRQDPQSAFSFVSLPTGIGVDDEWVNEVLVREITGEEEDIMMASSIAPEQRVVRVMENCVISIGQVTDRHKIREMLLDMTSGDRMALILGIRAISLGNEFQMTASCSHCGHEEDIVVDFSTHEIQPPSDPTIRERDFKIAEGSPIRTIRWSVMTGKIEARRDKLIDILGNRESDVTVALLSRVTEVDGKLVDFKDRYAVRSLVDTFKKLPTRVRNQLRNEIEEFEGGIDMDIDWTCGSCRRENSGLIQPGQRGFFFPSAR